MTDVGQSGAPDPNGALDFVRAEREQAIALGEALAELVAECYDGQPDPPALVVWRDMMVSRLRAGYED